jgi:hypothetical protein
MENLNEKQQEFVNDVFVNIAENDLVEVLENLSTNKIWYNSQICIKINDTDVNIAGTRFDEFKEENVNISFEKFLTHLKIAQQTFEFFMPDESITVSELVTQVENILK